MAGRNAIVMVSIGDRPWRSAAAKTFEAYGRKCNADFYLETSFPRDFEFPPLPDQPGRPNKAAYACKSYFGWRYLESHPMVLVVDDTCCVRRSTPDVFSLVSQGACGFTQTSPQHAEKSFGTIRRFVAEQGLADIPYVANEYMNSGVMVYDRLMRDAIGPDRINFAAELLFATYPHQTLTYFLLKSAEVPCCILPKAFNSFPAMNLPSSVRRNLADVRPYLTKSKYIYHVSAGYTHRAALVQQVSEEFLSEAE